MLVQVLIRAKKNIKNIRKKDFMAKADLNGERLGWVLESKAILTLKANAFYSRAQLEMIILSITLIKENFCKKCSKRVRNRISQQPNN